MNPHSLIKSTLVLGDEWKSTGHLKPEGKGFSPLFEPSDRRAKDVLPSTSGVLVIDGEAVPIPVLDAYWCTGAEIHLHLKLGEHEDQPRQ
jgi:hypothetical protein